MREGSRGQSLGSPFASSGGVRPGAGVDVRQWLGGMRISGFAVIMFWGSSSSDVFVLVPTGGTYLDQRRQIAAAEAAIALTQSQVDDLRRESQRWAIPPTSRRRRASASITCGPGRASISSTTISRHRRSLRIQGR